MTESIRTKAKISSDGNGRVDVVLPGDDEKKTYDLNDHRQKYNFVDAVQLEWGVMVAMTRPDNNSFWVDLGASVRGKSGVIELPVEALELLRTRQYEKIEL